MSEEQSRAFREELHRLAVLRTELHETIILNLCSILYQEQLLVLTQDQPQYFSSPFARHVFISDLLKFPDSLRRPLVQILFVGSSKSNWSSNQPSLSSESALNALQQFADRCDAFDFRSAKSNVTSELQASKTKLVVEQVVEQASAISQSEVIAPTKSLDEVYRDLRAMVEHVSEIEQREQGASLVVWLRDETGRQCAIRVWNEYVELCSGLWQGAILQICRCRERSIGRYHATSETLIIVEPEVLIDVTDVAECFQRQGAEPLLYFLRRFHRSKPSAAIAVGTIVNAVFDELIAHEQIDFDELFAQALVSKSLSLMAAIEAHEIGQIKARVQECIPQLEEVARSLRGEIVSIEPSFQSRRYGLQGRLDLMVEYAQDPHRKRVIELKSGSAPTVNETSSANSTSYGSMWTNHLAQVGCYNLLLDDAFPQRSGDSQILYARASKHPLRDAPNTQRLKQLVLDCRNRIVMYERQLLNRNYRVLNLIGTADIRVASFQDEELQFWRKFLGAVSQTERRYMQIFLSFILREQYAQRSPDATREAPRLGTSDMSSLSKAAHNDNMISDLELVPELSDFQLMHCCFRRSNSMQGNSLRPGDSVLLRAHPKSTSKAGTVGQIFKASLRKVDPEYIHCSFRNKFVRAELLLAELVWTMEADRSDSGLNTVITSFMQFFRVEADKRSIFLAQKAPRFKEVEFQDREDLSAEQNLILRGALASRDYFLIQGPPGTGKTSRMLRSLVQELLHDQSETMLIVAFTNRAVDEICGVLKSCVPNELLIRMGSRETTEHPEVLLHTRVTEFGFEKAREQLIGARVIVATLAYVHANAELLELKKFSTLIVDEAAQILEPQIVGIAAGIGRCIMIGDERQLPAIVTQSESSCLISNADLSSLGIDDLRISLFERLIKQCQQHEWKRAYAMLEQQGRMHQRIQDVASQLFYQSRLRVAHESQNNQYELWSRPQSENWLDEVLAKQRLIFIRSDAEQGLKTNKQEAKVSAEIARRIAGLRADSLNSKSIGIIAPFRVQIREIINQLDETLRQVVVVDTVERFQGSERDSIIISTAVESAQTLSLIQSLRSIGGEVVDRKFNVAITRAKQQLVLIGHEQTLRSSEHYALFIEACQKNGVVIDARSIIETLELV